MSNFNPIEYKITGGKKVDYSGTRFVVGILGTFVAILLIFSLIGSLRSGAGGYTFSFSGLLDYLGNAPQIDPNFSIKNFEIVGDWGIFNFLKSFLNIFTKLFGFEVWYSILIWNAVEYVAYFFSFIFAIG